METKLLIKTFNGTLNNYLKIGCQVTKGELEIGDSVVLKTPNRKQINIKILFIHSKARKRINKCKEKDNVELMIYGARRGNIILGTSYIETIKSNDKNVDSPNTQASKEYVQDKHNNLSISSKDKEYIVAVQECLSVGNVIAPTEHFLLKKLQVALKITDKRALELRNTILKSTDSLNTAEKEYKEAYNGCLLDSGYIAGAERYVLDRLRAALEITEERAAYIENGCTWLIP